MRQRFTRWCWLYVSGFNRDPPKGLKDIGLAFGFPPLPCRSMCGGELKSPTGHRMSVLFQGFGATELVRKRTRPGNRFWLRALKMSMPDEKQLRVVKLDDVLQKRRLGQALNAKEFAVLAGVSCSTAREWFRLPDFPLLQHVVFWDDFVEWGRSRRASGQPAENPDQRRLCDQWLLLMLVRFRATPSRISEKGVSDTVLPPKKASALLALLRKSLEINGSGEGTRTHITITCRLLLVPVLGMASSIRFPQKREKSGKQTGKRDFRSSKTPIKQWYFTSVSRKCSTTELTARPRGNLTGRSPGRKDK